MQIGILAHKLKKAHRRASWREIARLYDVTPAVVFRIAERGYEPKNITIRCKLGLPSLIPAPACVRCGVVHVSRRCPKKRKPRDLFDMPVGELKKALENRRKL